MKKLALILGTAGAAVLLAGGVVAAYVINDNAGGTGIIISPGEIVVDKTGTVTLEWGEMAQFTNIDGLTAGTPVTRTVKVKATVTDENGAAQDTTYQGKLDVELKDLSGKTAQAQKLVDYLSISVQGYAYVNNAFATAKTELGSITPNGESKISVPIYADAAGKDVDFVVSLDVNATPVMSEISTDSVYLAVDWNRGVAGEGVKRVYIPDNGWENMYVYSYSEGTQNKEWPGVKLERDPQTGLFVADLLAHDYFIFNDGGSNQYPDAGAEGMSAASLFYNVAAKIYFDWDQHTFVAEEPVTLAPFYLMGETTVWDIAADYAFEAKDTDLPEGVEHQWYLKTEVVTEKEYKVRSGDGNVWLGIGAVEENAKTGTQPLVSGSDNFVFAEAGEVEFYIKQYANNGGYSLYIAKEGYNPNPVAPVPTYHILGGASWETAEENKLALNDENLPENLEHQWKATVTVEANAEYKLRCGENDQEWHGLSQVEDACKTGETPLVGEGATPADDNFKFLAAGTYNVYLKKGTDGGFSIWIEQAQA